MSAPRRLVSIRRTVPPGHREAYDGAWERLRDAATERGAHAWRFAGAEREDLFLEFLEFAADADPRAAPPLAAALDRLAESFGASVEEWTELR